MGRITPFTVCMFSNLFPPVFSGSSTQCAQLAGELSRRGWKVVVIASRVDPTSREFEVIDGVHVYRVPAIRLPRIPIALNFPWLNVTFTRSNSRRILEILKDHPPDVIHLHNHMFDMAFHATNVARQLNTPLVITIHTIIKHPNRFYNLLLCLADRLLLKFLVIRQADMLICPDQIIKKYAVQAFGVTNATLIPYGIGPLPKPPPGKVLDIRRRLGIGEGPVILSLGHLHETRNRKELIEVLPQLVQHFQNLKVLIVGDVGTHTAEALATRLGVREYLVFTGAVPHSEVSAYLGLADIEAHWFTQSHPHKSPGIAAQEAMAAGKVVVTVADPDVYGAGILRDGENVILVELSDLSNLARRMIELLGNEPQRRAIGRRASQMIRKHFSWDKVCEQTIKVYQNVIRK